MATMQPVTTNMPGKRGETIEELFKQLPPCGKPDCSTHLRKDETINEDISRITTSEGMDMMYCMLAQKAKNANQGLLVDEDSPTMEDSMPELTKAEKLQIMQDKSDVTIELQRELIQAYELIELQRELIQAHKLSRLEECRIQPVPDGHQGLAPNGVQRENF
jgi:hypothetical protein